MALEAKTQIEAEFPAGSDAAADQRGGSRTAMFVTATCVFGSGVHPVRIRNMSRNGALLEGATLPRERVQFDLVRGPLTVRARSMWTNGNQCGAAFLDPVDVTAWMRRQTPDHQLKVDAMVHQARLAIAAGKPAAQTVEPRPSSHVANVKAAIALLEGLEGTLAEDGLVVARHLDGLQSLDRALQLLRLAAED